MQERQFPPFDSENLTPAERRALRRARARRLQALALGVGASVLALFAIGCPSAADLANPQDYPVTSSTAGSGTAAGSGTGGAPAASCETDCMKEVFQTNQTLCKLCHNNMGLKSAGLDLASDGFTARLKDIPATHTDLGTGMTAADCPTGDKLIDTANPANSWLLKKIHNEQSNCGTVMPSTGTLSATQKACIETYVACVAPGGAAPTGGSSSGGASTAGATSGGTGGGSSAGAATGGTSSGGTSSGGASSGSGGTGGA